MHVKPFEEQYKNALEEIERLITITKDKEFLEQLKKDKEYILNYLYPKPKSDSKKINFDLGITETKEEISDFIFSNQLYFYPLTNISFINKNDKQIGKLFNSFIEEDIFGLKNIYEEIILNNGLTYTDKSDNWWGRNVFIPSIKRNFMEIRKSKKLYEYNTKIHELGHAKTNIESYRLPYIYKNNSFMESYSIFLELVFADYLKNNGKKKQGYELKKLIFQKIKDITKQLYEELDEYKNDSETKKALKYFFEINYKTLKGYYLSLYFYYLYKSNSKESLKIINSFIKEVNLLSDNDILKKFNINKNCFTNENVYKLYKELKEEKIKIKSRKAE